MKAFTQIYIANKLDVSPAYVNQLVNCAKRPNWKRAKQLADITNTAPELWLDGTSEEIKAALSGNCVQPTTI